MEGFRPGVAERLGISYSAVRSINPGIVYCSISAFGQKGADRDRPAHDLAVEALAGMLSLNRGAGGVPVLPHIPVSDALASLYALSGVLMALLRRKETGEGDYVDVSMYESLLSWSANVSHTVFAQGVARTLRASGRRGIAMYQIDETGDAAMDRARRIGGQVRPRTVASPRREDLIPAALSPPGPGQLPAYSFLKATFKTRSQAEWAGAGSRAGTSASRR